MKTLDFRSGRSAGKQYLVLIHTASAPQPDEWRAYLRQMATVLSTQRELTHSFVATDGGGPNAAQRQELATLIANSQGDALTHVFTTDHFVRGIVTAFRWIARSRAVAHLPGEFAGVCAEAGVKTEDVLQDLTRAQAALAHVRTLQLIVDSLGPRAAIKR